MLPSKATVFPCLFHVCCLFHLARLEKATHIFRHSCLVAFSTFMLLERQHVAVFILLLLLFTSRGSSVVSGEAFFGRFLLTLPRVKAPPLLARHSPENSCFTSCKGSVPSGEAFFGKFLYALPRVRAPFLLARHFPENLAVFASYEESAAERAPNKEESFTGHSYVLTNKMPNGRSI